MANEPLTPEREQEIRAWLALQDSLYAEDGVWNGRKQEAHHIRLAAAVAEAHHIRLAAAVAEIDRLRAEHAVSIRVRDNLFVHGTDEATKIVQDMGFALETLSDDRYCTEHCPETLESGGHFVECAVAIARGALEGKSHA